MGRYEDDKKGGLFPTRTGPAIGASKARGMLDNLGGSDSFRTKIWNQPDGSTTRLKTKDGMPEFITEPNVENRLYIDKFFATPSSETYRAGYVPPGTDSTKGPFSEWVRWMGKTLAPSNAGSVSANGTLNPVRDLDDTVPGSVTWYSSNFKLNGYPLVLSWRGNNSRAGTYGELGETSISTWTTKPSSIDGFRLEADCFSAATDFSEYVWLSDKIRIEVGIPVWSAALRKISGVTYLYVVSGDDVYRSKISLFAEKDGGLVLNSGLSKNPLLMTFVGNFGVSGLSQMPFFNSSGNKIVLLRSVKKISTSPIPSPDWSVSEVDIDTLSVTPVFTNMCTHDTPAVTAYISGTFPSAFTQGFTLAAYNTLDYKMAVAADYRGDQLVYVTLRISQTRGAYTVAYSATNDGAGLATFTMTTSDPAATDVLIVEHSEDGKIFEVVSPTGTSVVRSYSGTQDVPNSIYNVDSGITASGTALRFEMTPFLIAADLRHDFTMFSYRITTVTVSGSGSWSHPGNTYSMTPGEDSEYDSVYLLYMRDQELFRVTHQYGSPSSSSTSSSVGAPAPFSGISTPSPAAATQTRYDNGPYSFVMGDTIGGDVVDVCAKVAHITTSPDGKAAYIGLCWMETDTEVGVDEMYFTFVDSNGSRILQKIPASTYAPGAASYLSGGIFYPRILEFP